MTDRFLTQPDYVQRTPSLSYAFEVGLSGERYRCRINVVEKLDWTWGLYRVIDQGSEQAASVRAFVNQHEKELELRHGKKTNRTN